MALKGRIEEYGLAELLQLILQNQKRGTVLLSDDVDEVRIDISDGYIIRAENESRPQESELASRLATVGYLNGAQLGKVLKLHAETEEKMARILLEGGYAPLEIVRTFATLQAVDTLFETFMWKGGSYEFEEREVPPPAPWIEPISADFFLVRGIELVDEWPAINQLLPSSSQKVSRLRDLPSGEHAALIADLHFEAAAPDVGDAERQMFELCRPGLHVKTVLDRMAVSRFEASRALANLIRAGYVGLE